MISNGGNSPFFLLALLIVASGTQGEESVPVYLWQTENLGTKVPALSRISPEAFGEILEARHSEDGIIVAFAEPSLSPEDFNTVSESGKRVFSRLAETRRDAYTMYLPQVRNPLGAVSKLFDGNVATISPEKFNVDEVQTLALIIDLNDVKEDEDRNRMLARHDEIIVDIYEKLVKKYSKVVAVFTGRRPSWVAPQDVLSRKVRDTEAELVWRDNHVIIYSPEQPLWDGNAITNTFTVQSEATTANSITTVKATFTSSDTASPLSQIVMTFKIARGYWSFETVKATHSGTTYNFRVPKSLFPPATFSYQCTTQTFRSEPDANAASHSLVFKNLQIQPFTEAPAAGVSHRFGDPYFCVGFTSPAIWSGIFVTFILAAIMALGITMMMDMKTMDRFDDPKGKTIIINASE